MAIGLLQGGILEPKFWNAGFENVLKEFESEETLNKF